MTDPPTADNPMSAYERKRWNELQAHWAKRAEGRKALLPPRARAALDSTAKATRDGAAKASKAVADRTPETVKDVAGAAVGAALVQTVHGMVQILDLLNDWVVELTDPNAAVKFHQAQGRDVEHLAQLRELDLEHLEAFTDKLELQLRTIGLFEGGGVGALATFVPVPVVGSVAAIGLDMIVMQAVTAAIATRICYSYGYDATDPSMKHVIDRMVGRAYMSQVAKAGSIQQAAAAYDVTKLRVNWSQKLRDDHRLMAAVEKLMKSVGGADRVPVQTARKGMPFIAVVAGAATNMHVLGDTVKQARHYGATMLLAEKHGLELPQNLRNDLDVTSSDD